MSGEAQGAECHDFAVVQQAIGLHGRVQDVVAEMDVIAAAPCHQHGGLGVVQNLRAGGTLERGEGAGVVAMGMAGEDESQIVRRHAERAHVRQQHVRGLRHPSVDQQRAVVGLYEQRGDACGADLPGVVADAHRRYGLPPRIRSFVAFGLRQQRFGGKGDAARRQKQAGKRKRSGHASAPDGG